MFTLVACAGVDIPDAIAGLLKTIYTVIKIAVPLILVLMGMIDLGKAVISQKEDEKNAFEIIGGKFGGKSEKQPILQIQNRWK